MEYKSCPRNVNAKIADVDANALCKDANKKYICYADAFYEDTSLVSRFMMQILLSRYKFIFLFLNANVFTKMQMQIFVL